MHKISFLDLSLRINNSINLNLPVANELRKAKFTRIMTPVTNHGIFNGIFNVIYSSLKVSFVFTFEKIYVNFQYFINHTSYHAIYLAVAKGNHHRWTHSRVWPCCQNYCIWCMLLIIFGWNSAIFQPSLLSVSLQPFLGKLLIRLTSKYMYIFCDQIYLYHEAFYDISHSLSFWWAPIWSSMCDAFLSYHNCASVILTNGRVAFWWNPAVICKKKS